MNQQLQEVIAKILLLESDQVTPELKRDEVEDWDSMTHLVLVSDIENEFDISFSDEEVVEIESVADIITLLTHKGITTS